PIIALTCDALQGTCVRLGRKLDRLAAVACDHGAQRLFRGVLGNETYPRVRESGIETVGPQSAKFGERFTRVVVELLGFGPWDWIGFHDEDGVGRSIREAGGQGNLLTFLERGAGPNKDAIRGLAVFLALTEAERLHGLEEIRQIPQLGRLRR